MGAALRTMPRESRSISMFSTSDYVFFRSGTPLSLRTIALQGPCELPAAADPARLFAGIAVLERAGFNDVTVLADGDAGSEPVATRGGACFVAPPQRQRLPASAIALVTAAPLAAFRRVAALLQPESLAPGSLFGRIGIDPAAIVHGEAKLEAGVTIDPGAVIGPQVEIGSGTTIGANSVIGAGVRIGRGCSIDAHVSIRNALIGDGVIVHAGARIGLGGPDLAARREQGWPSLGRVIIQDRVEIGANVAIERGGEGDTVLGEGSRVAALMVVDRGVTLERHAVLTRQSVPSVLKIG